MPSYKINSIKKDRHRIGWMVNCTLTDGENERGKTFYWPTEGEPTENDMNAKLIGFTTRFALKNSLPETIQDYTKDEVEDLLREKGFLNTTETIEDLKTLTELKAVAVIK